MNGNVNGNANGNQTSKTLSLLESIHKEILEEQELNVKTLDQMEKTSSHLGASPRIPDDREEFTYERLQKELAETQKLIAEIDDEEKEFA